MDSATGEQGDGYERSEGKAGPVDAVDHGENEPGGLRRSPADSICAPSVRRSFRILGKPMPVDPREVPIYSVGDASGYLHIPAATLRSWTVGRTYQTQSGPQEFEPLIPLPKPDEKRLSFSNLVEAHVLRGLRTRHRVSIRAVRQALSYAEEELGIRRLLLSDELLTSAGDLFLDRYGQLINLTKSGQLAVRKLLEAHLERVERGEEGLPRRLFPFLTADLTSASRLVVIDPTVSFGRPTIVRKGVSTQALVDRIDAGEEIESLAEDYQLTREEVEVAVVYERAA